MYGALKKTANQVHRTKTWAPPRSASRSSTVGNGKTGITDCSLSRLQLHVVLILPSDSAITTNGELQFEYDRRRIPAKTSLSILVCTFAASTGEWRYGRCFTGRASFFSRIRNGSTVT